MSIDFDLVWNKAFGKSRGKKLLKDIFKPFQTISKSKKAYSCCHVIPLLSVQPYMINCPLAEAVMDKIPASVSLVEEECELPSNSIRQHFKVETQDQTNSS